MNNEMIKGNKKSKKLYIESLENDVVVRKTKNKCLVYAAVLEKLILIISLCVCVNRTLEI